MRDWISLLFGLAAGLTVISGTAAAAELPKQCAVPPELVRLSYPLPNVSEKLQRGEPVKIVAIGSSSTAGTGASSARATYPSQLQADLKSMFPRSAVTVINRGVPGDTSSNMIGRFKYDAIEPKPDLIIWQTGTNSALDGGNVERFTADVRRGIRMARKHHIEIMLMSPQFAPRFESVANRMTFIDHLRVLAEREQVPVFQRYEVMKHWIKSGQFTNQKMINPDGLHMTDLSYGCIGWLVARMIGGPAIATAHAVP
jgi:lysophospholipase L1-like esterase